MRSIQEIFNVVIDSGCYSEKAHQHMCPALWRAVDRYIISAEERQIAAKAIRGLLTTLVEEADESNSLGGCIDMYLLDTATKYYRVAYSFPLTLSIYRDWDNAMNIINSLIVEKYDA